MCVCVFASFFVNFGIILKCSFTCMCFICKTVFAWIKGRKCVRLNRVEESSTTASNIILKRFMCTFIFAHKLCVYVWNREKEDERQENHHQSGVYLFFLLRSFLQVKLFVRDCGGCLARRWGTILSLDEVPNTHSSCDEKATYKR